MTPFYFSLNPESLCGDELDLYLSMGWFRMRQSIFTSSHVELGGIYRVHWLRFAVEKITERTSHKRIRNRAKQFRFTIEDFNEVHHSHAKLHSRYRDCIDFDGAWTIEECLFGEYLSVKNIFHTKCISVFDQDKLIAAGYFDVGQRSAASILHFFDPQYKKYSLGKFLTLLTIDYLRGYGYEFYYPGYVVQGQSKMNYKLFLGEEHATYFEPDLIAWIPFYKSILIKTLSEGDSGLL